MASILKYYSVIILLTCSAFAQSPYKTSWNQDGYILGGSAVAAITAYSIDERVSPLSLNEIEALNRNDVSSLDRAATYNWSEKVSTASDLTVGAIIVSPALFYFSEKMRKDYRTISIMYAETMMLSLALPSIAKAVTVRKRPFVYNPDAPGYDKLDKDAKRSFFSQHATFAFASATFLSSVYSRYYPDSKFIPYIWAGSLLTASLTGYLRFEAGMHFPTDILTGALVGGAVGYLIPKIHESDMSTIGLQPSMGFNSYGISFTYSF